MKVFVERCVFAPLKVGFQNGAHQTSLLHCQKQINEMGRPVVGSSVENDEWLIYRLQSFFNEIDLSCCVQMTQTGPLGFSVFMECKYLAGSIRIPVEHQCILHFVLLKNARYVIVVFVKFRKKSTRFLLCHYWSGNQDLRQVLNYLMDT